MYEYYIYVMVVSYVACLRHFLNRRGDGALAHVTGNRVCACVCVCVCMCTHYYYYYYYYYNYYYYYYCYYY